MNETIFPVKTWTLALSVVLTYGCGSDTTFSGGNGSSRKVRSESKDPKSPHPSSADSAALPTPELNEPPAEVNPYLNLSWNWDCPQGESTTKKVGPHPGEVSVVELPAPGSFEFEPENFQNTTLNISGELCSPAKTTRDIVFIVDVSGSMKENDPIVGESCGRLRAIEQILAQVEFEGISAASIVTFGSQTEYATPLVFSQSDLFNELKRQSRLEISDVLCAQRGNTNYQDALRSAESILSSGSQASSKEIYFISDGQPTRGQEGVDIADRLKNRGVKIKNLLIPTTIATIMLDGEDLIMRDYIASRLDDGTILHAKTENADELANLLTSLFENEVIEAVFKFREIGIEDWTEVDLKENFDTDTFEVVVANFDKINFPNGFEAHYSYREKHGRTRTEQGRINWRRKNDGNG